MLWGDGRRPRSLTTRARAAVRPLYAAGELAELWRKVGLREVEDTSLLIRMDFAHFDDYWQRS